MNIIEKVFEYNEEGWGLRGDPHMWDELKIFFININKESLKSDEFGVLLDNRFNEIIKERGKEYEKDSVWIEDYPQHGMSGGHVSVSRWNEKLIPMLKENYRKLKEEEK